MNWNGSGEELNDGLDVDAHNINAQDMTPFLVPTKPTDYMRNILHVHRN
jgi:hypothetical protein